MNILFAASEAYPIIKTGGLGDVIYSLPRALKNAGLDVRVILPAYRVVLEQIAEMHVAGWLEVQGAGKTYSARILETRDKHLGVPLMLVDVADLFDRAGNPYLHPDGYNWDDNAERFTVFSRAVAQLANDPALLDWQPDVVHCHDWQTGLIPALLGESPEAPRSIFTIHNLSYSGMFPHEEFSRLQLPETWWSHESVEFFGNFSMLKAGIVFADQVTTVSPNYANEIRTPGHGYGFDGVLRTFSHKLHGILNGIDQDIWNPATDPYLPHHYSLSYQYLAGKRKNKEALLRDVGATADADQLNAPLLGLISRLVEQKGIDLLLDVIPRLIETSNANFVILGSGENRFEQGLLALSHQYPDRLYLTLGYSEELAHRIEAGSDMFLMPSRFEPCGLNQMYSLRYGTPPVVHHAGGLADTVVNATTENLENKTATGFVFYEPTAPAFLGALEWALTCFQKPATWHQIMKTAMSQDFGWNQSAEKYRDLYASLRAH